jgi:hypothetical protein
MPSAIKRLVLGALFFSTSSFFLVERCEVGALRMRAQDRTLVSGFSSVGSSELVDKTASPKWSIGAAVATRVGNAVKAVVATELKGPILQRVTSTTSPVVVERMDALITTIFAANISVLPEHSVHYTALFFYKVMLATIAKTVLVPLLVAMVEGNVKKKFAEVTAKKAVTKEMIVELVNQVATSIGHSTAHAWIKEVEAPNPAALLHMIGTPIDTIIAEQNTAPRLGGVLAQIPTQQRRQLVESPFSTWTTVLRSGLKDKQKKEIFKNVVVRFVQQLVFAILVPYLVAEYFKPYETTAALIQDAAAYVPKQWIEFSEESGFDGVIEKFGVVNQESMEMAVAASVMKVALPAIFCFMHHTAGLMVDFMPLLE